MVLNSNVLILSDDVNLRTTQWWRIAVLQKGLESNIWGDELEIDSIQKQEFKMLPDKK